jgi:predicted CxxxxCH...CXXCH cytochrome family protein
MRLTAIGTISCLLGLGIAGCGKLAEDLPAPAKPEAQIHEVGWNDQASANFHGTVLHGGDYNYAKCVTCHAKSFSGGTSGVGCFGCHQSFPHKAGWKDTVSTNFHGKYLRLGMGELSDCAKCHGAGFDGGTSGTSCYACHASYPHKTGWLDPAAAGSHGKYLKAKNWLGPDPAKSDCAGCHGANLNGGSSGKSCFTCHASYPHTVFAAASGHAGYLFSQGYPLAQCKTCHGATYAGGAVVNISCSSSGCHVDNTGGAKSPEACNTCHGQFRTIATDALSAAPPKGVFGDSLTSARAVGAHSKHLLSGSLGKTVRCAECHTVPTTLFAAGHVDNPLPAEVVFNDTLARLKTGGGTFIPTPSYNSTTLTCANTYCHGSWQMKKSGSVFVDLFTDSVMVGKMENSVTWTGGSSEAACGNCHALPPTGHRFYPLSDCKNCHGAVVNGSGEIINQALHMNGKANTFGAERAF